MQKNDNDYSISTSQSSDLSSPKDIHMDSASIVSSESHEKQNASSFKAPSDLAHIIFTKLQEISRQNLENGFVDQALQGYDRCTEQLITILKGDTDSPSFQDFLFQTLNYLNDIALRFLR